MNASPTAAPAVTTTRRAAPRSVLSAATTAKRYSQPLPSRLTHRQHAARPGLRDAVTTHRTDGSSSRFNAVSTPLTRTGGSHETVPLRLPRRAGRERDQRLRGDGGGLPLPVRPGGRQLRLQD